MRPLILASCSDEYHDLYANPFRNSAEQHGMEVRIVRGGNMNPGAAAALRYLKLPHVLKEYPSVLVLDIDSIINEPIDFNDKWDIGLFLRTGYDDIRKKVLGSVFYIHQRAIDFAWMLRKRLKDDARWYEDQVALYKTHQATLGKYKVKLLGTDFINWHCTPASIWTGKGEAKTTNEKFLAQLKRYS